MSEELNLKNGTDTPKFEDTTPDVQRKRRRHLPHGAKVAIVIVSIILVIAMLSLACYLAGLTFFGVVIALVIVSAMPENDGVFEYKVYGDTVEIVGLVDEDYSGRLYIPEYIDGMIVTEIGSYAFNDLENITEVYIPDAVTCIGRSAFVDCPELRGVEMGDGVEVIETNAFAGCYKLEAVAMSESLTSIQSYAFYNCYNLKSIIIPGGVCWIGSYAFDGCENLYEVFFENPYNWTVDTSNDYGYTTELETGDLMWEAAFYIHEYSEYAWEKNVE